MWKQPKSFPNKQEFKKRVQDSMQKHNDPKGEGGEHVWAEEKESRKDPSDLRECTMYKKQKSSIQKYVS